MTLQISLKIIVNHSKNTDTKNPNITTKLIESPAHLVNNLIHLTFQIVIRKVPNTAKTQIMILTAKNKLNKLAKIDIIYYLKNKKS